MAVTRCRGVDLALALTVLLDACAERPAPPPEAAAESAAAPAPPGGAWTVTLHGAGPARYGMTLAELGQATGDSLVGAPAGPECGYLALDEAPAGMIWMIEGGRLVRVDVDSAGLPTDRGAAVGMTEVEVHQLYGGNELEVQPHKYVDGGRYLVYLSPEQADSGLRIVFETDGQLVTRFRAGILPAVAYVEGCS